METGHFSNRCQTKGFFHAILGSWVSCLWFCIEARTKLAHWAKKKKKNPQKNNTDDDGPTMIYKILLFTYLYFQKTKLIDGSVDN